MCATQQLFIEGDREMRRNILKKVVAGVLTVATVVSLCFTGGNKSTTANAASASGLSGVSKVSNMPSNFARGVDISEVIALEKAGVAYKYYDGSSGDIFDILAGAGVMELEIPTFGMQRCLVRELQMRV